MTRVADVAISRAARAGCADGTRIGLTGMCAGH
jgi:hypothetical protein